MPHCVRLTADDESYPMERGTMPRRVTGWMLLAAMTLAIAAPAGAGNIDVAVRDDEFDPSLIQSKLAGDSVLWGWMNTGSTHNVRQVRGLFRSPLSSEPGTTYVRTFSAGTFPYECEIHAPSMVGTVKVEIWQGVAPSGLPLIKWAFPDSNTGKAFDVQFRIGNGPWRKWRKDTISLKGVFGRNERPVHFNPAREYWFRVRSQKSVNTPHKISRWSPATLND